MRFSQTYWAILCGIVVGLLPGCAGNQQATTGFPNSNEMHTAMMAAPENAVIERAWYSGDVIIKVNNELPSTNGPLPFVVFLGVAAESETRLQLNAFIDMNPMQARLPSLVTGIIDETCDRKIELDLQGIRAEAEAVRARGVIQVTLFDCEETHALSGVQGAIRLSQTVDAEGVISGRLDEDCVEFELKELELRPRGVWGYVTNLFFSSKSARIAVLKKVNAVLSSNRVCPDLPNELTALSPRFFSGSLQEIGQGGIGAKMSGSIDISAPALIEFLTAIQDRGLLEGKS